MDDLISRQAVLQICREKIWNGADDYEPISSRGIAERVKAMPSVQPNLQPACNNLATDTISRQAAIDALIRKMRPQDNGDGTMVVYIMSGRLVEETLNDLPSAQPEIIRCLDCKYWREHKYAKETKKYIPFCGFNAIYTKSDDFCSKAERRTDEPD